jgi:hypothetical protein
MIHSFPCERALLPRTKLAYANLPGILRDGTRDRQARVPAYVVVQIGERCYLILLRDGEPFFGARLAPDRAQTAISEIVTLAEAECERGEAGQIGFYMTGPDHLLAMASTLAAAPLPLPIGEHTTSAERLFPVLRERAFTGVLELAGADGAHHHLVFRRGAFQEGWFADRDTASPVVDVIRSLFDRVPPRPALYPLLDELPLQASPSFIELYRRVLGGTVRELGQTIGFVEAVAVMDRARELALTDHPVLGGLAVGRDGRVTGEPVSPPGALTEASARWLTEALTEAADAYGVDPGALLERVGRDGRFVLQEHGFFSRLPWALTL